MSLLVATEVLQSFMIMLSTPAPCWPGPSKSTRPTNSSWKGRRRAPRRTVSTFQPLLLPPLLLLGACHTSSRLLPSTTTSARKPWG